MSKFLEVENLVVKFGDYVALDNIHLTLNEGEILGIIGKSAAGKTVPAPYDKGIKRL